MRRLRNSFLVFALFVGPIFAQSAEELESPAVNRVAEKLLCPCGCKMNMACRMEPYPCRTCWDNKKKILKLQSAGFSSDRLSRINIVMKEHITTGRLNGASGLIARNGKVVFRETWGAYKPDTIVRMYSMTKAITGVAAMILYEEGKFSLTDPVSKYLPEFTKMSVAQESFDAAGQRTYYTVPANHPITVRD